MLRLVLLVLVFAASSLQAQQRQLSPQVRFFTSVDAPVVALTNVRVIDGTGADAKEGQTIVIEGETIRAVGPASQVTVPAGAQVIDLAGHTVIPGIVGLHDHMYYSSAAGGSMKMMLVSYPKLFLGAGVTTIRTAGSTDSYQELNIRGAIERGQIVGPGMFVTGPYLQGGGPGPGAMHPVEGPDDARRMVRYWAEEGVTWFKAYTDISRESLAAAIKAAHARGLKFTGHLCSVSFREAVALGIDNLEHGLFTNSDYVPNREPDHCPSDMRESLLKVDVDGPQVQQTIKEMVASKVAMSSTLAVYELSFPDRPPLEDRVLEALSPEAREEYLTARKEFSARAAQSTMPELFRRAQAFEVAFVKAGGLLASGVDPTGVGGALPGFGDQRNYELLIEAGFTPVQAIRIMTLNGATILGVDKELGSVAAGKLADLVVIRGNPVATPAEIRNVTIVFKGGIGYDSPKLIASVKGLVGIR